MERIRQAHGGQYFEHPVVDWENTCKVVAQAGKIVHCDRPFSVLGACAASNSASTLSRETMKARFDTFERENSGGIRLDQPFFPFSLSDPGVSLPEHRGNGHMVLPDPWRGPDRLRRQFRPCRHG